RMVAPLFIQAGEYGTRSSAVVRLDAAGEWRMAEQSWDSEGNASGPVQNSHEGLSKITCPKWLKNATSAFSSNSRITLLVTARMALRLPSTPTCRAFLVTKPIFT